MMTLPAVVAALQDRNLKAVADKTGLAYDTVRRVANDMTVEVSYKTIEVLSDYLEGKLPNQVEGKPEAGQ